MAAGCRQRRMNRAAQSSSPPCPVWLRNVCKANEVAMAASTALRSVFDIEAFMIEYYAAWGGTDEDRIMSYYADNVTIQIPGSLLQGKLAVREQFVRPF